jgi:hypothetical protein
MAGQRTDPDHSPQHLQHLDVDQVRRAEVILVGEAVAACPGVLTMNADRLR